MKEIGNRAKSQFKETINFVKLYWKSIIYVLFMNIPRGKNKAFDLFKDYAKEVGGGAIIGDSFMVVMIVLLASFISKLSYNANIIILIVTCYFFPYLVYF